MNTPREWEDRLKFEILEDYIREAENAWQLTPLGKEEYLPKMRAHFENLKSFIRTVEDKAREEERERVRKLVELYIANAREHTSKDCEVLFMGCVECAKAEALSNIITALKKK